MPFRCAFGYSKFPCNLFMGKPFVDKQIKNGCCCFRKFPDQLLDLFGGNITECFGGNRCFNFMDVSFYLVPEPGLFFTKSMQQFVTMVRIHPISFPSSL